MTVDTLCLCLLLYSNIEYILVMNNLYELWSALVIYIRFTRLKDIKIVLKSIYIIMTDGFAVRKLRHSNGGMKS